MATIATVVSVSGKAYAFNPVTRVARLLKAGDSIDRDEIVQTAAGAQVEVKFLDGKSFVVEPEHAVRMDESVAPTSSDSAATAREGAVTPEAIIETLARGGDLTEQLEATAAGLGGGGGGQGNSGFVRLLRISEEVTPLSYAYDTGLLPGIETLQSEPIQEEPADLPPLALRVFQVEVADGDGSYNLFFGSVPEGSTALYVVLAVDETGNPLTTVPAGTVNVSFTDGSATGGVDYVGAGQTVSLGELFQADILDDYFADNAETFSVDASSYSDATSYSVVTYTGTGTIISDNSATPGPGGPEGPDGPEDTVQIQIFAVVDGQLLPANTVIEGETAHYVVHLTDSAGNIITGASGNVTIAFNDGTAVSPNDYTHRVVTIGLGVEFTADAVDDTAVESSENFTVNASDYTGAGGYENVLYGPSVTTVITDNDVAPTQPPPTQPPPTEPPPTEPPPTEPPPTDPPPTQAPPEFRITGPVKVDEDVGTVTYTISLNKVYDQTVSVQYATQDGTAVAGQDYTAISGVVTFPPGQTSTTVRVPISADTVDEPDENYLIVLSAAVGASISKTEGEVTTTIFDNDGPPAFRINDFKVPEGETAIFTVTRVGDSSKEQKVTVTRSLEAGDTAESEDFVATPQTITQTITFAVGQTEAYFAVPTYADEPKKIFEGPETFTVTLSNPTNGAVIDDPTGIGTILDDGSDGTTPPKAYPLQLPNDDRPVVSEVSSDAVQEGETLSFTVTLSNASEFVEHVALKLVNGTATVLGKNADIGTVSINGDPIEVGVFGDFSFSVGAGVTEFTVTIATTIDANDESRAPESFTLQAATDYQLVSANGTGTIAEGDGTIVDPITTTDWVDESALDSDGNSPGSSREIAQGVITLPDGWSVTNGSVSTAVAGAIVEIKTTSDGVTGYTYKLQDSIVTPAGQSSIIDTIHYTMTDGTTEVANSLVVTVYDDGPVVKDANNANLLDTAVDQILTGVIVYDLGADGTGPNGDGSFPGGVTLDASALEGLHSRGDPIEWAVGDSNNDGIDELIGTATHDGETRDVLRLEVLEDESPADGSFTLSLFDVIDLESNTQHFSVGAILAGSPTTSLLIKDANTGDGTMYVLATPLAGDLNNKGELEINADNGELGISDTGLDFTGSGTTTPESVQLEFGSTVADGSIATPALINNLQVFGFDASGKSDPDSFEWVAWRGNLKVGEGEVSNSKTELGGPNFVFNDHISVDDPQGFDTLVITMTSGHFKFSGFDYEDITYQPTTLKFGYTVSDGENDSIVNGEFSATLHPTDPTTEVLTYETQVKHPDAEIQGS